MEELIRQLATRRGFIEAFWARLRTLRAEGSDISQEKVFEELSDLSEEAFGEPCFPSFSAFRKYRDRRIRK